MLVRPSRSSTLSSAPNFSRIGARVGGGGPCKRDGAPASTAFLKLRSVCFRRISWRALYNAIDNFSSSGDPFRSDVLLQVYALPTTSDHAVLGLLSHASQFLMRWKTLAMAVVSVPSAGTSSCDAVIRSWEIRWTSPSGFQGIVTYRRFSLNIDNLLMKPSSSHPPLSGHRRHHRC